MNLELVPIISDLRSIYDLANPMDRYNEYVKLMLDRRGEQLPLGDFSPMGKRQQDFLDHLLVSQMEQKLKDELDDIARSFKEKLNLCILLLVLDEPQNGWTQRYLTEYELIFGEQKTLKTKKEAQSTNAGDWVAVQLWTTDDQLENIFPDFEEIRIKTIEAIARKVWRDKNGSIESLRQALAQEIFCHKHSRRSLQPIPSREKDKLISNLDSHEMGCVFAYMYGDTAAGSVGYSKVGVSHRCGFRAAAIHDLL